MYEIYVWVPTKGWKLVRKHRDADKARESANDFLPLEVKVCNTRTGRSWHGGALCMPLEAEGFNNLHKITERMHEAEDAQRG